MADHHGSEVAAGLEDVVVGVLGAEKLLIPDDLRYRGSASPPFPTLREAVRVRGWPSVDDMRGKFMFVLWKDSSGGELSGEPDEGDDIGAQYYNDHQPSLESAVLFTRADPEMDDGAFVNWDQPMSVAQPWFEPGKLGEAAKAAAMSCPEGAEGRPSPDLSIAGMFYRSAHNH